MKMLSDPLSSKLSHSCGTMKGAATGGTHIRDVQAMRSKNPETFRQIAAARLVFSCEEVLNVAAPRS